MFDFPYIIEILTPLLESKNPLTQNMKSFSEKYHRIHAHGFGVSIPDNPMGRLRHGALEAITFNQLPVESERTVMNLNTFHTKKELDNILKQAHEVGITKILVVRGDGGPQLSPLNPADIGSKRRAASSSDLIRHINSEYRGQFIVGAAFNPYNPEDFELEKVKEKIEAGAQFIITQPIIGKNLHVDRLAEYDIPIVIEAWMSENIDLLYKSVKKKKDESASAYNPAENLKVLHSAYPESCMYLSLLSFTESWKELLPNYQSLSPENQSLRSVPSSGH